MSQEKHEWQFRDQVVPARLCYLGRDGDLSFKDLLLLMVVHSLVRPQGTEASEAGIGCWASNGYLAKAIDSHEKHVARRIGELRDMGLLLVFHIGKQRYLETEWARTAEERDALVGEYGKICRLEYSRLLRRLSKDEAKVTRALPISNMGATTKGSAHVTTLGNMGATQYIRSNIKDKTMNIPRSFASEGGMRSNRIFFNETSCPVYLLAQELYHACGQKQLHTPSSRPTAKKPAEVRIADWAACLKRYIHREDIPVADLQTLIRAYIPELGSTDLPQAYSARAVCQHFPRLWEILVSKKVVTPYRNKPSTNGHANGHTANGRNGYHAPAVSPEAKQLATTIEKLPWPKDAGNDFAAIAQQSITNYELFVKRFLKIAGDKKHKHYEFARLAVRSFRAAYLFLPGWFEQICEKYQNWEDWSGYVKPFTDTANQLDQMGSRLSGEIAGKASYWKEFMKALREVSL